MHERDLAQAERNAALHDRDRAVAERDAALHERDRAAAERDAALHDRDRAAAERDALGRARQGCLIQLDYPVFPRRRRWRDHPGMAAVTRSIAAGDADYRAELARFADHAASFRKIPVHADGDAARPFWANGWIPGLDAITLYGMVATRNPRYYVEVGSGNSTKFVRQAIRDHQLRTAILSIDPHPRAEIDKICDNVIRQPCEDVDLDFFARLTGDDLVFIDNSHRSFQNSDVTVFFMEILGALPPGLIYGIHDIFLPDDYPEAWHDRFYNEQYLLAAYLIGGAQGDRIVLPNAYLSQRADLTEPLQPIFTDPLLYGIESHGGIFWMQRRPDGPQPALSPA